MPWVRFTDRFDWRPPQLKGRVTYAYKAGSTYLVTTPCAEAALAKGKAVRTVSPKRKPVCESPLPSATSET